jgi:hypothetical protein
MAKAFNSEHRHTASPLTGKYGISIIKQQWTNPILQWIIYNLCSGITECSSLEQDEKLRVDLRYKRSVKTWLNTT